jgi:hypothetical protein
MKRTYRWESEALGLAATLTVAWQDGAIHGLDCPTVCDWDEAGNALPPRSPSAAEAETICDAFTQTFDTGWWDTRQTIEQRCEVVA